MTTTVVCRACGWASFAVSRSWAERQIAEFNACHDAADPQEQESYGRRSSLDEYRCLRCGGAAFRPKTAHDRIPYGATLNPVVCDAYADNPRETGHDA